MKRSGYRLLALGTALPCACPCWSLRRGAQNQVYQHSEAGQITYYVGDCIPYHALCDRRSPAVTRPRRERRR